MGVRIRVALAAAIVGVGCVVPVAHAAKPTASRPTVVVALADSGVNPYHQAFYRPQNTQHPCTWVKGFTDCSIPALNLSIGTHRDFASAVRADRAVWASVRPHQWYWIPKTNIIGAVCDVVHGGDKTSGALGSVPEACILDEAAHGTATASAVLSEAPDALLLIHEGTSTGHDMPTAPLVPDIQSHSWGSAYVAPIPFQVTRPVVADPCPVGNARPETLVFLGAGNDAPTPTLLDCQRARPEIQVVGGGYPGYFEPDSWTVFDFASWYCRPTAWHASIDEQRKECGTSLSTPTAAGAAAAALLRIRQHDGYSGRSTAARVSTSVTRTAFVDALRNAASYEPKAKFPVPCLDPTAACFDPQDAGFAPLPKDAPYAFWGYGWLDSTVSDTVVSCALSRRCPTKSAEATSYNEQRQQAREIAGMYALSTASDDAGSGRDADRSYGEPVPVRPGTSYVGRLAPGTDWQDAYTFRAKRGQTLTVSSTVTSGAPASDACWSVFGPHGDRLTPTAPANTAPCAPGAATPARLRLPAEGTYTVVYSSHVPHDYRFSVSLA